MAYRTERTALGLVLGLLAAPGSAPAQSAAPELGVWINHTGKGAIETYLCGSNLCGKIVWLKEPNNDSGKPKRDANNPDPSKRNRPVCGVHTLANLKRTSGGWSDGQAYNPEEGKTYDVSIRLADSDTLKVTGSVLFFSKTVVWKRAKGQLQRCDKAAAPPPAPTAAATPAPAAAPSAPVAKPVATTPAAAAAAAASATAPAPVAPPAPAKPAAVTAVATPVEPAAATPAAPVTAAPPAASAVPAPAPKPAAVTTAPQAPAATPPTKPATATGVAKPAPQAKAVAPTNKPVAAKAPAVPAQTAPTFSATKPAGTGIPTATGYAGSSDTSAYKPRPKPRPQAVDAGSSFDPTPQASR